MTAVRLLPVASCLIPLPVWGLRAHMLGAGESWSGGQGLIPQIVFQQLAIKTTALLLGFFLS